MDEPDYFERLGLPRRFAVDAADLERNYLARSRAVHPDFHAGGPAVERDASVDRSAALNEAYEALRDPIRRAEYVLSLFGGPSASECKDVAPAFLAEMMDAREAVEETHRAGNSSETRRLEAELLARLARLTDDIAARLTEPADLADVRRRLNEARYLRGLIRDLTAD